MASARKRLVLGLLVWVASSSLAACGRAPAVRYAHNGDFPALARELDGRAKSGDLDDADVRDVARAVLEHDLQRFSGDEGVNRTLALSACAKPMTSALEKTAKGDDDVAAAAAWVLVDSGALAVDTFSDAHKDDPRPRWRAAATRGLIDAGEGALRTARAADDDQWVRLAAVEAAGDAGCATDFPLLLESARKDPMPIVRVDAVRGLAKIAPRLDGPSPRAELVERIAELWADGDDAMRGAVARAWGSPTLFSAGGRQRLESALGKEEGHATIEAASAMMMAGASDGALVLSKMAKTGDPAVRAHALRLLDPARPDHAEVLLEAMAAPKEGAPDDANARVVAATALLHATAHRAKAVEVLVALMARQDRIGTEAAIALAEIKDERARPRLVSDLATPSFLRFRAASGLVRLGHPEEVRSLLASTDLDVRDGAACSVLATPKG
ncbi:MAG: hypothetical protein HYV09_01475 [Deltaproteobacteria bacterium]|nr:hypothetical protein [Deltaproteobacteria bacterium]